LELCLIQRRYCVEALGWRGESDEGVFSVADIFGGGASLTNYRQKKHFWRGEKIVDGGRPMVRNQEKNAGSSSDGKSSGTTGGKRRPINESIPKPKITRMN